MTYTPDNPLFNILKSTIYICQRFTPILNGANKTYLVIHCLRVANTILLQRDTTKDGFNGQLLVMSIIGNFEVINFWLTVAI